MIPIIQSKEINEVLTDPGISRSFIRAAHKAFHVGKYPDGAPLHKNRLKEYGIASLLMWPLNTEAPHIMQAHIGIRLIRARLHRPVREIHFLRYVRLTPMTGSTVISQIDDSELAFSLKEGTLYFMNEAKENKQYAIEGGSNVEVNLKSCQLRFS